MVEAIHLDIADGQVLASWDQAIAKWSMQYVADEDGVTEMMRYARGSNLVTENFAKLDLEPLVTLDITTSAPDALTQISRNPDGSLPLPELCSILVVESTLLVPVNEVEQKLTDLGHVIIDSFNNYQT